MRRVLWLCVTFIIFSFAAHARSANSFVRDFDDYIETVRSTWTVPGIAVAVVEDGEVVLLKGYGVRDLASGEKVDTHTVFQLASLSKTFAATLTGMLVERRYLSFDYPVAKFLPDLTLGTSEHYQKITLRHVLSHTSGFPSHAGDPRIEGGEDYGTILDSFKTLKILYEPGKVYDYQNAIFALSGAVIEDVTGSKYEEALKSYLLETLGMDDTTVGLQGLTAAPNKALPYRYRKTQQVPIAYSTKYYSVLPAAGVNASIADMAQWLRLHMGDFSIASAAGTTIIKQKMLDELHAPLVSSPGETWRMRAFRDRITQTWYGLGFRTYDYAGHSLVTHGGMLSGFNSLMAFSPEKKVGLVVLSNSSGSPAVGIIRSWFFDRVLDLSEIDWNAQLKLKETEASKKMENQKIKKSKSRKTKKSKSQKRSSTFIFLNLALT